MEASNVNKQPIQAAPKANESVKSTTKTSIKVMGVVLALLIAGNIYGWSLAFGANWAQSLNVNVVQAVHWLAQPMTVGSITLPQGVIYGLIADCVIIVGMLGAIAKKSAKNKLAEQAAKQIEQDQVGTQNPRVEAQDRVEDTGANRNQGVDPDDNSLVKGKGKEIEKSQDKVENNSNQSISLSKDRLERSQQIFEREQSEIKNKCKSGDRYVVQYADQKYVIYRIQENQQVQFTTRENTKDLNAHLKEIGSENQKNQSKNHIYQVDRRDVFSGKQTAQNDRKKTEISESTQQQAVNGKGRFKILTDLVSSAAKENKENPTDKFAEAVIKVKTKDNEARTPAGAPPTVSQQNSKKKRKKPRIANIKSPDAQSDHSDITVEQAVNGKGTAPTTGQTAQSKASDMNDEKANQLLQLTNTKLMPSRSFFSKKTSYYPGKEGDIVAVRYRDNDYVIYTNGMSFNEIGWKRFVGTLDEVKNETHHVAEVRKFNQQTANDKGVVDLRNEYNAISNQPKPAEKQVGTSNDNQVQKETTIVEKLTASEKQTMSELIKQLDFISFDPKEKIGFIDHEDQCYFAYFYKRKILSLGKCSSKVKEKAYGELRDKIRGEGFVVSARFNLNTIPKKGSKVRDQVSDKAEPQNNTQTQPRVSNSAKPIKYTTPYDVFFEQIEKDKAEKRT